ncbi:hypothetical protein [Sutterella wadsworthensis]|uniref:hypothetical protein n=1 Tax=Sutterella wadsworthensis TaxID=40545 RepID=UPI003966BAFC
MALRLSLYFDVITKIRRGIRKSFCRLKLKAQIFSSGLSVSQIIFNEKNGADPNKNGVTPLLD